MSKSEAKPAPEFRNAVPKRPRRSRSAQSTFHVLIACVMLSGAFALYFLFAERATESSTKLAASERPPAANHIGHVKIFGEADCKKRLFDNSSGTFTESHPADCTGSTSQNPNSLYVTPTNRLDAIRRGFGNR